MFAPCLHQYIKCLYVYNKIDTLSIEEVDELARKPHSVVISIYLNLNIDYMLQMMWKYMGLIRIYTKRRGQAPDINEPIVLSVKRDGLTVEAVCKSVSQELLEIFSFALVWGRSTKYNPQRVGSTHFLADEDVVQIVPKTLVQQKHSKDYRQRVSFIWLNAMNSVCMLFAFLFLFCAIVSIMCCQVDAYNLKVQKERRRLRKIK